MTPLLQLDDTALASLALAESDPETAQAVNAAVVEVWDETGWRGHSEGLERFVRSEARFALARGLQLARNWDTRHEPTTRKAL